MLGLTGIGEPHRKQTGKRARILITGGAGGIGLATVRAFVANMPSGDPEQFGMTECLGAARHSGEAEIGGVGEQRRNQPYAFFGRRADPQMTEALGESPQPLTSVRSSVMRRRGNMP